MSLASSPALPEKYLRIICTYFKTVSEIKTVILFGSRAMGTHKKGSDIDLAVSGRVDPRLLLKIQSVLNEELPIPLKFDLMHLETISHPDLLKHIDEKGKIIYPCAGK